MRTLLIVALLLTASTAQAIERRLEPRNVDPVSGTGLPSQVSAWQGGPNSLPYNWIWMTWDQIRNHAEMLDGVQPALQEFANRGYIRRADLDTAYTSPGVSAVVLAFEKPGEDPRVEQPIILVQSFAVEYPDGWWPVTMIGGMIVRDSVANGTHIPALTGDAVLSVVQYETTNGGPIGPEGPDWDVIVAGVFSMKEAAFMYARNYAARMTADEREWWDAALQGASWEVLKGFWTGGIGGWVASRGTVVGALIGAGAGGAAGAGNGLIDYMRRHPYPKDRTDPWKP
jgi:hypothetical protein